MQDKDRIIYELWKLLDDIDTASDMFARDYKGLAEYVYKIQQKRHGIVGEEQIDALYDRYYPPQSK